MRYLGTYKRIFKHEARLQDLTLHVRDHDCADVLSPISELLGRRGHEPLRGSLTRCLDTSRSRFFVKTEKIDSFPSRMRATFGMQRSDGGHTWLVEELRNSVEAFRRGAPVPQVAGFGYQRRGRRLVREFFLVSEMLDGHVNGMEWIRRPGIDIESFLQSCFSLFKHLHDREIFHLDLWLANIMVDPANPDQLRVVDLENCHIGAAPRYAETLGFQFGFFYFRFVREYLTEARYDELVSTALQAYGDIDGECFSRVYELAKHRPTCRKKRRLLISQGKLATK